jgi:uncharacterized protein DUF1648
VSRSVATAVLALAIAGLASTLVLFAVDYGSLPALVPTHFGADGSVNAWGPKSTFVLFPVMAVVFFGLFVVAGAVMGMSSRPTPPAVPLLFRVLAAETIWLFFFIELGTLAAANGHGTGLGVGFFVCLGLVLATALATVIYGFTWALRYRA